MVLRKLVPLLLMLSACGEERIEGICYCSFFSGDEQEYDLRDMSRADQVDACNTHDENAEAFVGHCDLE